MFYVSPYEKEFETHYDQYFSTSEIDDNLLIHSHKLPSSLTHFIIWLMMKSHLQGAILSNDTHQVIIKFNDLKYPKINVLTSSGDLIKSFGPLKRKFPRTDAEYQTLINTFETKNMEILSQFAEYKCIDVLTKLLPDNKGIIKYIGKIPASTLEIVTYLRNSELTKSVLINYNQYTFKVRIVDNTHIYIGLYRGVRLIDCMNIFIGNIMDYGIKMKIWAIEHIIVFFDKKVCNFINGHTDKIIYTNLIIPSINDEIKYCNNGSLVQKIKRKRIITGDIASKIGQYSQIMHNNQFAVIITSHSIISDEKHRPSINVEYIIFPKRLYVSILSHFELIYGIINKVE